MTDKQILKKAIEKAMKNGWKIPNCWDYEECSVEDYGLRLFYCEILSVSDIIFDHDFAKAFFGEEEIMVNIGRCIKCKATEELYMISWIWHLQQMVKQEEPLKYLEKFL